MSTSFSRPSQPEKNNKMLLDYSSLVDTDFGTVVYLIRHCSNSKYFKEGYKDWTDYFIQCLVLSRKHMNPLSAILKEEYWDQMDPLYEEILHNHWKEVLHLSHITDISKLIRRTYNYAGYQISVNCRNELEVDTLKELRSDWKGIINAGSDRDYFFYLFHDVDKRLAELGLKIQAKSIYVYYHKPNFMNMKQKILNLSTMFIIRRNIVKIIEPYIGFEFPYDMTPDDVEEVKNNGTNYKIK